METTSTRYIPVADCAKLIRTELKTSFPGIKFSVRSSSYSGGASVTVNWTDGPTSKAVEAVCNKYEGASFDGMQDLKSYHKSPHSWIPTPFRGWKEKNAARRQENA